MPKVKISEYSATANSNTDVASINIDEGCAPSGINNAIRAVMGHLKDFQSGTSNDTFTVGSSGSLTLSYGTANGVAYLNGSKVLTTGSALSYNGSSLAVTGSTAPQLIATESSGLLYAAVQLQAVSAGGKNWTIASNATSSPLGTAGGLSFRDSSVGTTYLNLTTSGLEVTQSQLIGYSSYAGIGTNGLAVAGNVGIGTSSPAYKLDVTGAINATNTSNTTVATGGFDASTSWSLKVANASTTAGTGAGIFFLGGTNSESWIGNLYESSGVGALSFQTRVSGTRAERMRIDSSGNLLVGLTSGLGGKVNIPVTSSLWGIGLKNANASGNMVVFLNSSDTSVGSIFSDASSTSYVTSSDYRLKNTISPMTGALDKVAQLKPVTYKWNADGSDSQGFIAHELAEVCPQAVIGEKDAINEDGSIKPQGIDTSFLVATLTAAMQEQQALITQLTARITALESA